VVVNLGTTEAKILLESQPGPPLLASADPDLTGTSAPAESFVNF